MTLVAGLSIGGEPAFVGDLLTSWRLRSEVTIPSQPSCGIFEGFDGHFASGLAQKLTIVRPYLMLAYAGSLSAVRKIVDRLDAVLPLTVEEVIGREDTFLEILDTAPEDVEMLANYFNGDLIWPIRVRTSGFEIDGRQLYIMGTGREVFFNFVVNLPGVIPPEDATSRGLMARAVMMRFAANAMMSQWKAGYGLNESWGGGFEVSYVAASGFKKLDNILLRAWSLGPNGELRNIGTSFLQHYEGDDLHLTAFADEACTTVVPSLVPSVTHRVRRQRKVIPEWTVDLIEYEGHFVSAIQLDRRGSRSHAKFEFEEGKLVAWQMDKSRLNAIIDRVKKNIETGIEFQLAPL